MSNFDIGFSVNYSDEEKPKKLSFTMTFKLNEHPLGLGFYVVYPSLTKRELVFIPKYKFDNYVKRFEELSERFFLSQKEKEDEVKPKNRQYYVSEEDATEIRELRCIISHSHVFPIKGMETSISLPYKYITMLQAKVEYLTFVQTDQNEFLIINPEDAWMYSGGANNYAYSDTKAFFNRSKIRKAI